MDKLTYGLKLYFDEINQSFVLLIHFDKKYKRFYINKKLYIFNDNNSVKIR